jgi:hypothetical protein
MNGPLGLCKTLINAPTVEEIAWAYLSEPGTFRETMVDSLRSTKYGIALSEIQTASLREWPMTHGAVLLCADIALGLIHKYRVILQKY